MAIFLITINNILLNLIRIITICIVFFITVQKLNAQGQISDQDNWTKLNAPTPTKLNAQIQVAEGAFYNLDFQKLSNRLTSNLKRSANTSTGEIIMLPYPDGTFKKFQIWESSIMSAELEEKFPNIKTYSGHCIDDKTSTIRLDLTSKGLHAIILSPQKTIYIDPLYEGNNEQYICYDKRKFIKKIDSPIIEYEPISKYRFRQAIADDHGVLKKDKGKSFGTQLYTFRIAVAATGEYTAFHGGTVEEALAAIVVTMNRVNAIYEREVSVRMILVADNDRIIYTDADTDPYTNNNSLSLLNENQENLDDVIGTDNYDIGHVFSTASGGVATLGSVCDNQRKARGTTGTSQPIGDPFDVDFVAHEIGHQFGASHTFNGNDGNCQGNRNGSTAVEPGSGTTIMAYAGICDDQNIQPNSNDYFSTISYEQIVSNLEASDRTGSCAVITATGNDVPTVDAGVSGFYIPVGTPFTLDGSGNDINGDDLTYCWEQVDLGPTGEPNQPQGNAPLFRSFPPAMETSRTFPQWSDILNNTQTQGEILPAVSREMNFRLTVRDNNSGGGGVNFDELSFNVTDEAGPFIVTTLNEEETMLVGAPKNITWDVANTDTDPVNVSLVNILLSVDGGITFPIMLAENVPNDGLETIIVPDNETETGRIKVEAVGNVFFDLNNSDFIIEEPVTPDFVVSVVPESTLTCDENEAIFQLTVTPLVGYSEMVNFVINDVPEELTAGFAQNPVSPGETVALNLSGLQNLTAGMYTMEIVATSNNLAKNLEITLDHRMGTPSVTNLIEPQTEIENLPVQNINFLWNSIPGTDSYTIEIADNSEFTDIFEKNEGLTDTTYQLQGRLEGGTTYYWRIKGSNPCGEGGYSEPFQFTTQFISYSTHNFDGTPQNILSLDTLVSMITIDEDVLISDLNVIDLNGTHTWIGDVVVKLQAPSGTEIILFEEICSSSTDFGLSFDDEAGSATIQCPPTGGFAYIPQELLEAFDGEKSKGDWKLIIIDSFDQDEGTLIGWGLEIGTIESPPRAPEMLAISDSTHATLTLTWLDNSTNEEEFVIERSKSGNTEFQEIARVDYNTTSFTDTGLEQLTNYYYRISANNSFGFSEFSNEAHATTLIAPPFAPTNLQADAVSHLQIDLIWSDNADNEDEFVIERSIGNNQNFQEIARIDPNSQTYPVQGLEEETTYYFRVYATNDGGDSDFSNESDATTLIVGLDNPDQKLISIFPNPTKGMMTLEIGINYSGTLNLILMDALGRTLRSSAIKKSKSSITHDLDLTNLQNGIYFLNIISPQGTISKRLSKQ
ncbi:M12 family metallo-peptidase [Fulvivirgaceae bacterium BMA10]|uniref:M12 family metallo-peptidase n=1 Tax=Splendidivirga corallicola TaxID=3051826 RepID=A0ABT8KT08_9BACT|nr:M12 family metallo-peptidase [Fulvivirgaceae bacterium BMA10]